MDDKTATSSHTAPPVPDFASLGLAAAADAIRSGEITSEAYATALLRQARTMADLNSFITIDEDAVLAAAKNADKARSAGSAGPASWRAARGEGQLSHGVAAHKFGPR
jgi:indoleacetamide hydrolase